MNWAREVVCSLVGEPEIPGQEICATSYGQREISGQEVTRWSRCYEKITLASVRGDDLEGGDSESGKLRFEQLQSFQKGVTYSELHSWLGCPAK